MLVVALAEGRAEARPGLEEGDPIEALFGEGSALPPELRERVEADPKLKHLIEDGAAKGDFTAAQEEASRQAIQIVNDNLDQFSDDDLAQMFAATDAASNLAPTLKPTAAGLHKSLDARRAATAADGGSGSEQAADGGAGKRGAEPSDTAAPKSGAATLPADVSARLAGENACVLALYRALRTGSGNGPTITGSLVTRFLDLVEPLTDAQRNQLRAIAVPAAGETEDEFIAALRQAIAAMPAAGPENDADAGASSATRSRSAQDAQPESQDAGASGSQQPDKTPDAEDISPKRDQGAKGSAIVTTPRPYCDTADDPPPPINFITDLSTLRTKGLHTIRASFTTNGRAVISSFTVIVTDVTATVATLKTTNNQALNLAPPCEPAIVVHPNKTIKLPLTSQTK
jgi:hypothetical protein